MMIKRIAFQLLGEKYTKLAIAWHQFITYLYSYLVPYKYDINKYSVFN